MARGRYGSRGGYFGAQDSTEGPPLNVTQGPKAMRESIRNIGNYPVGGRSQFEDRLRALEADNYRYQAEKRQDRDRVLELEEQISLLKEQQDRKLKQEIRELRAAMNHAINQTIKR